jgi:hypothetical protein
MILSPRELRLAQTRFNSEQNRLYLCVANLPKSWRLGYSNEVCHRLAYFLFQFNQIFNLLRTLKSLLYEGL